MTAPQSGSPPIMDCPVCTSAAIRAVLAANADPETLQRYDDELDAAFEQARHQSWPRALSWCGLHTPGTCSRPMTCRCGRSLASSYAATTVVAALWEPLIQAAAGVAAAAGAPALEAYPVDTTVPGHIAACSRSRVGLHPARLPGHPPAQAQPSGDAPAAQLARMTGGPGAGASAPASACHAGV
jgi:hypothetical protein